MVDETEVIYVFSKEAVLGSIARLVSQPIHEHFAGYLAILRSRSSDPGLAVGPTDIKEFHERYLHVMGAPNKSPFVRPFKSRGHGLELFNSNVAGSYGASSIRAGGALADIFEISGSNRNVNYELKKDHISVALKVLLKGRRVPAASLAAFLYRDYGFYIGTPDVAQVLQIFRKEFGLAESIKAQRVLFDALFEDDTSAFPPDSLVALAPETTANA